LMIESDDDGDDEEDQLASDEEEDQLASDEEEDHEVKSNKWQLYFDLLNS
jgi:hypothetical protein